MKKTVWISRNIKIGPMLKDIGLSIYGKGAKGMTLSDVCSPRDGGVAALCDITRGWQFLKCVGNNEWIFHVS